jgi:hypothetical protein
MSEVLDAGRQQAGLTIADLWLACYGIGWVGSEADLTDVLDGDWVPSHASYNEIAQALNEAFIDRGGDHPVPYAEEL